MDVRMHPYVVHFSVGLILSSVTLFLLGAAFRQRSWSTGVLHAARWNLWIGAACALASIGTGFVDYISNQCDAGAIEATVLHRRSGAVTWWSSLIAGVAAYRTRERPPGRILIAWLIFVAVAALTATRLGTDLTYGRGLGIPHAWPDDIPACFEMERQAAEQGRAAPAHLAAEAADGLPADPGRSGVLAQILMPSMAVLSSSYQLLLMARQ